MPFRKKRVFIGALLALVMGLGAYGLWSTTALRDRPWQLESYVDILAAKCRTGPGAYVFSEELRALTAQVNEAKLCLLYTHEAWAVSRDYTPCLENLLRASHTALRIAMSEATRLQEEKRRFGVLISYLESDIGQPVATRTGARFEIRNLSQSRARTLIDEARSLAAHGQSGSALIAALRARAAWAKNEDFQAAELARFYDSGSRARWDRQAQDLLRWTRQSGRSAILVDKLEHRCLLLTKGKILKSYTADLGRNWYRDKVQEHDASTPEGEYKIKRKFRSPSFGWALLLDYPNAADWQHFNSLKKAGDIARRARIGGNIEIHGGGRGNQDWTDGCVSLGNSDMADLYKYAYPGMPVTVVGTSSLGISAKD